MSGSEQVYTKKYRDDLTGHILSDEWDDKPKP